MDRSDARPVIEVFSSHDALFARAVEIVAAAAACGPVALSGGDGPRPLYEALATRGVRTDWYQVDERFVPYGHADSNATMIERAGLRLHRIPTDGAPEDAAARYEEAVRGAGTIALAVMGIGPDGHTASLFPDAPELDEGEALVVATRDAHAGHRRITMTLPLINAIEGRVFLVTGESKRDAVRRVLVEREPLPATRVAEATWLLDAAAAGDVP